MKLPAISYNFGTDIEYSAILPRCREMAAAGMTELSLEASQLKKIQEDPGYRKSVDTALAECNMTISDIHAPHFLSTSLGNPLPNGIENSRKSAMLALETAAEYGVRTVTIHTARTKLTGEFALEFGEITDPDLPAAKERILRTLDLLLPFAEKHNIVIAIENLFLPSSTAEFVHSIADTLKHPNLGLCYDSGHALLLEKLPGKSPADIAGWIACGWPEDKVELQADQLDVMLPHVVTAHLHDNNGFDDQHLPPGQGVADWQHIIERLHNAPRLITLQSELMPKFYKAPAAELNSWYKKFEA